MKLTEEMTIPRSEQAFELQTEQIFRDRKYQKAWKATHFILKNNFAPRLVEPKSVSYTRYLFFVIPVWYLTLFFKGDSSMTSVEFCYYTKGLEFLDIFGIKKKWKLEIEELRQLFKSKS